MMSLGSNISEDLPLGGAGRSACPPGVRLPLAAGREPPRPSLCRSLEEVSRRLYELLALARLRRRRWDRPPSFVVCRPLARPSQPDGLWFPITPYFASAWPSTLASARGGNLCRLAPLYQSRILKIFITPSASSPYCQSAPSLPLVSPTPPAIVKPKGTLHALPH